jgi:preprotein translocase subunit SecE
VAERRRRGGQAASGRRAGTTGGSQHDDLDDELHEDGHDEDALAEAEADVDDLDDELLDDDEDSDDLTAEGGSGSAGRGSATATKTKRKPAAAGEKSSDEKSEKKKSQSGGRSLPVRIFGRFATFVREVVAELRKVIWPTRSELVTYTTVVIAFVTIMLTIVGLLDVGFAKAVMWAFGGSSKSAK